MSFRLPHGSPFLAVATEERRKVLRLAFVYGVIGVNWCWIRPSVTSDIEQLLNYAGPFFGMLGWLLSTIPGVFLLLGLGISVALGMLTARERWLRLLLASMCYLPWLTATWFGERSEVGLFAYAMAVPPVVVVVAMMSRWWARRTQLQARPVRARTP